MKRYLVFAGDMYEPGGAFDDFVGDTDSNLEAVLMAFREADGYQWLEIVDTQERIRTRYTERLRGRPVWDIETTEV